MWSLLDGRSGIGLRNTLDPAKERTARKSQCEETKAAISHSNPTYIQEDIE
jgi:hypothetical protein